MKGNLLTPLSFSFIEGQRFVKNNGCGLCGGYYTLYPEAGTRNWNAKCACGYAYEHTAVSVHALRQAKEDQIYGLRDLNRKPVPDDFDPDAVIKSLGF
jgi:hypothetical protein